jgi:glyoxylase-like metal-dependent hydrolase (beta-lactamase superfamily II)
MRNPSNSRRAFLKNAAVTFAGCHLGGFLHLPGMCAAGNDVFKIYKFEAGGFQCTLFKDCSQTLLQTGSTTHSQPEPLDISLVKWEMNTHREPSPFVALLIEAGDKKILVDTGIGRRAGETKIKGHTYQFSGKLKSLLISQQVDPAMINHIILTHFHPDHIGGIFDENGALNFPNARFIASKAEFDYWTSAACNKEDPLLKYFIKQQIEPLKKDRLTLWTGSIEAIFPNIRLVNAAGHTPGHLAVGLGRGLDQFLFLSDTFFHPTHIKNIHWRHHFDFNYLAAQQTRKMLLDWACHENMLAQAFHFDFPGLGYIVKDGNGWAWEALKVRQP